MKLVPEDKGCLVYNSSYPERVMRIDEVLRETSFISGGHIYHIDYNCIIRKYDESNILFVKPGDLVFLKSNGKLNRKDGLIQITSVDKEDPNKLYTPDCKPGGWIPRNMVYFCRSNKLYVKSMLHILTELTEYRNIPYDRAIRDIIKVCRNCISNYDSHAFSPVEIIRSNSPSFFKFKGREDAIWYGFLSEEKSPAYQLNFSQKGMDILKKHISGKHHGPETDVELILNKTGWDSFNNLIYTLCLNGYYDMYGNVLTYDCFEIKRLIERPQGFIPPIKEEAPIYKQAGQVPRRSKKMRASNKEKIETKVTESTNPRYWDYEFGSKEAIPEKDAPGIKENTVEIKISTSSPMYDKLKELQEKHGDLKSEIAESFGDIENKTLQQEIQEDYEEFERNIAAAEFEKEEEAKSKGEDRDDFYSFLEIM